MKRGLKLSLMLLGALVSMPARAQEQEQAADRLGLAPGVPQADALPGGTQPAYGQPASGPQDWRFDFHGFFTAPLRVGLNHRDNLCSRTNGATCQAQPTNDQSNLVLHAPPVVPDDLDTFSHTGVVPLPYAQMNFSYGNSIVTGNVILLARVANVSSGFFDPSSQLGVNDVFLNFNLPDIGKDLKFEVNLGQFSNRYGVMGEYDEGRYGTPLIARTNGAGENIIGRYRLGNVTLFVEQGFQGQSDKAPTGLVSDGWNGFADPNVGTSYVSHAHIGAGFMGMATVGLHYMNAFSQDDRATGPLGKDGAINILGGDLRLTLKKFGHFYVGASMVKAEAVGSVGRIVEVLNTRGGPGLIENYLGKNSGGNGKLTIFGAQYDLSLARLMRSDNFTGNGPDIFLSLFGMGVKVKSDDPFKDNFTKVKFGAEGSYSLLPWLAAGVRYDMVKPDTKYDSYNFAVLSPRVIFRTGWQAHDQVTLQYSHWFNGKYTTVKTGYPAHEDVTVVPDEDMVSLSGSMWW
ncbi:MAG TPA: hypothetical protein VHB79_12235 [Polyangiaceae bacterium]|nr:hypothetical protein [Polyangiaceae bacterium]